MTLFLVVKSRNSMQRNMYDVLLNHLASVSTHGERKGMGYLSLTLKMHTSFSP